MEDVLAEDVLVGKCDGCKVLPLMNDGKALLLAGVIVGRVLLQGVIDCLEGWAERVSE